MCAQSVRVTVLGLPLCKTSRALIWRKHWHGSPQEQSEHNCALSPH